MSTLTLLTAEEQAEFDSPPTFTDSQRRTFFALSEDVVRALHRLQGTTNKVCFFVQWAYFKSCQQFFDPNDFISSDVFFAAKVLEVDIRDVDVNAYQQTKTPFNQQRRIAHLLGYQPYNGEVKMWLTEEVKDYAKKQVSPQKIFLLLLKSLQQRCIVFPTYHALSKLIGDVFYTQENRFLEIVKNTLSHKVRAPLAELLITDPKNKQTPIRIFKVISQSLKPKAIKASLVTFNRIKSFFDLIEPTLNTLKLHEDCRRYYATWVRKAKLSQLQQFPDNDNLYLHLMAFLQHQVFLRQDYFIDVFLKSVQTAKNSASQKLNRSEYASRKERRVAVKKITTHNQQQRDLIDEITEITSSTVLNDRGKVTMIEQLLDEYHQKVSEYEREKLKEQENFLTKFASNQDHYHFLGSTSLMLQNRVSGIIQSLTFDAETSEPMLIEAIEYFVKQEAKCDHTSPIDFLSPEEKTAIFDDKKKFCPSLYKALFFIKIADAIKSGKLNLKYSYRFKAIQEYLISKERWKNDKMALLKKADFLEFIDVDVVLQDYKTRLSDLYHQVNHRYKGGLNPYLKINDKEKVIVTTPAQEEKETEYIADLLSQLGYVPILQVFKDINRSINLTDCFEHHNNKNVRRRPSVETFFAGLIGLGCNIGIPKMGQISTGVNPNTLYNTVNWYFSIKNLKAINTKIVQQIHDLALSDVFVDDPTNTHSSSDGRKVNVKVDSLLASLSFKYFGKDKGVSVYTFIDERQALFHSLVMSASEREAAYVYDGLLDNEVDHSDIHSTDTHGYREGIFSASPFMKTAYAPRIKNIGKQKIYAFSKKKIYENKGYDILPSDQINQRIVKDNWDDILRFMATIKLKEVTASQLFKRLSSYAKHHPLYRALKEFGRIVKSVFILKYYDDVILRQRIEKQLNRIELSNKFANAVFFANSGEFKQGDPEEQALSVACKVIIQNTVVLWNYLYLSQLLTHCDNQKERDEMVTMISQGSVITWRHVNLHGEYDFRRDSANERRFDMGKILSLSLHSS